MGFPVWSRAISAKGTVKATLGSVNIPVVCAGALVQPGDVIVADDDGVVVRAARAGRPDAGGRRGARGERGREARQAGAGVLGLDMYKMREPLAAAGLQVHRLMRRCMQHRADRLWRGRAHPGRAALRPRCGCASSAHGGGRAERAPMLARRDAGRVARRRRRVELDLVRHRRDRRRRPALRADLRAQRSLSSVDVPAQRRGSAAGCAQVRYVEAVTAGPHCRRTPPTAGRVTSTAREPLLQLELGISAARLTPPSGVADVAARAGASA